MGIMDIEDVQSVEGLEEAKEKVEHFILNILESIEMEISEYAFSVYQHGRGGEEDDPVATEEYERKTDKREVLIKASQELAESLVDAAHEDVENFMRGKHKYAVRCEGIKARCVFTLTVNDTEDEDMDDIEETPNKKGLLSQLMRHQEKIMKVAVGSVKNVIDMQRRTIESQQERVQQLEGQQLEGIRLAEELISGKHTRDLELRRIEKKEKRMDELTGMVMQGAPLLLHMVAQSGKKDDGGEGSPAPAQAQGQETVEGASRIEQLTSALIHTFTPEQLIKIQQSGLFQDEQIMTLIEIARAVQEKKTGNS